MEFHEAVSFRCAYAMEFLVDPGTLETEETLYYECGWDGAATAADGTVTLPDCTCKKEALSYYIPTMQMSLCIRWHFFSILLTHEGSHREAYRDFQPSLTSSSGGAKGCSDHRFRAPPAYTAQLLTLHQHRANNQYRTANQI